ncbi:hypothetical protein BDR07DRAFT_158293 [Suillus spraguei]|nr:hypothetical protein BDR07DRAFT_158293 [Suillus spraguei]
MSHLHRIGQRAGHELRIFTHHRHRSGTSPVSLIMHCSFFLLLRTCEPPAMIHSRENYNSYRRIRSTPPNRCLKVHRLSPKSHQIIHVYLSYFCLDLSFPL